GIFQSELGALRNALFENDHPARSAHRVSEPLDALGIIGDVDHDWHSQQNALRAAPFFGGRLSCQTGAYASRPRSGYRSGFRVRRRLHSSSPQKSISGATSSTPYSQPSGRWLPFHTIIAALLESVARLLRARRCSRLSDCERTTMQP